MKSRTEDILFWVLAVIVLFISAWLFMPRLLFMGRAVHRMPLPCSVRDPIEPSPPEPTSLAAIDKIIEKLEFGNIAFNTPTNLQLGEMATIELLLSPQTLIEQLQNMVNEAGRTEGYTIKISNEMEACLSGSGFKIEAYLPEAQTVSTAKTTKWLWEIEPTKPGNQQLHLTLSARLYHHGLPTSYVVRTFDRTIEVEVNFISRASNFISHNWKWLWTAAIVPIVGWGWKRYKRKTQSQQND